MAYSLRNRNFLKLLDFTGNSDVKYMHCLPSLHNRKTIIGEDIYKKFDLDGM